MAGNKEVLDLPVLAAPIGSHLYAVKSDTDYRVPVGEALGIATLGADGLVPSDQLPPNGYLPIAGAINQVLIKLSATNYDVGWATVVPAGGIAGQYLVKNSATNFDSVWTSAPPGSTPDFVLQSLGVT